MCALPELEANVHGIRSFIACQLDKTLFILESDWHGEVVNGAPFHNAPNLLCKQKHHPELADQTCLVQLIPV